MGERKHRSDHSTDSAAFTLRDMEDEVDQQKLSETLQKLIDGLDPLEKEIITLRFEHGLDANLIEFISFGKMTKAEIANAEKSALHKLRSSRELRYLYGATEVGSE